MASYQIKPYDERSIPDIASFMVRSIAALLNPQASGTDPAGTPHAPAVTVDTFRWLLDEDSPYRDEGFPAGEAIWNDQGAVVGMIGYHPCVYLYGDRRLRALGAHNFYVDPSARMQGFILFRRYLNNPNADFCFSTTCNANSVPLWAKCGAAQVPESESEYLLILRHGQILEEMSLRKGMPPALARAFRLLGPLADLVMHARPTPGRLRVERCTDWEQLGALAEKNRNPARPTPERLPADLRRKYETATKTAQSTGTLDGVYRFTDAAGRDGWFSVAETLGGVSGQIRSLNLLDLIWPRGSIDFSTILRAVAELAKTRIDCLRLRDRCAWGLHSGLAGLRRRTLPVPEAFLFRRPESGLPSSLDFAQISDFPDAYGV
jgi:hypothetical protein